MSRGGPKGNRHAWKHGRRSRETLDLRAQARSLIREINVILGKSRRPSPRGRGRAARSDHV